MSNKSYLKNQIKLISLNANDAFTEDEWDLYMKIISYVNEIDKLEPDQKVKKKELIAEKKKTSSALSKLCAITNRRKNVLSA